jgi:hypothetical protein
VVEDPAEVAPLLARVPVRAVLRQPGPVAEAMPVDPHVRHGRGGREQGESDGDQEGAHAGSQRSPAAEVALRSCRRQTIVSG